MFLLTRRKHYWQLHWEKMTRSQNFFAQCPKKKEETWDFFSGKYVFQTVPVNT